MLALLAWGLRRNSQVTFVPAHVMLFELIFTDHRPITQQPNKVTT